MNGIDCMFEGLHLIRQRGLRQYVLMPIAINVVIFAAIAVYGYMQFETWIDAITRQLPEWLSFLSWLIGLIAIIVAVVFLLYGFTILANIIAAPSNAILSVKVEESRLGELTDVPEIAWWRVLPRAVARELAKLFYYLPRLLALLVLSLIPVVTIAAPVLLLLFSAWMMAVEYTDYAADNNEVDFRRLRERLSRNRVQSLLFGIMVYVLMAIPVINLILMPAAVAGGTVFWVEHLRGTRQRAASNEPGAR